MSDRHARTGASAATPSVCAASTDPDKEDHRTPSCSAGIVPRSTRSPAGDHHAIADLHPRTPQVRPGGNDDPRRRAPARDPLGFVGSRPCIRCRIDHPITNSPPTTGDSSSPSGNVAPSRSRPPRSPTRCGSIPPCWPDGRSTVRASGRCCEPPPCTWTCGSRGGDAWRRHSTTSRPMSPPAEPTCTGEQMALHIVVVTAAGRRLDDDFDDLLRDVPAHPDDIDWISPLEFLFEDYDVLTLFDPEPLRTGSNLDPGTGAFRSRITRPAIPTADTVADDSPRGADGPVFGVSGAVVGAPVFCSEVFAHAPRRRRPPAGISAHEGGPSRRDGRGPTSVVPYSSFPRPRARRRRGRPTVLRRGEPPSGAEEPKCARMTGSPSRSSRRDLRRSPRSSAAIDPRRSPDLANGMSSPERPPTTRAVSRSSSGASSAHGCASHRRLPFLPPFDGDWLPRVNPSPGSMPRRKYPRVRSALRRDRHCCVPGVSPALVGAVAPEGRAGTRWRTVPARPPRSVGTCTRLRGSAPDRPTDPFWSIGIGAPTFPAQTGRRRRSGRRGCF